MLGNEQLGCSPCISTGWFVALQPIDTTSHPTFDRVQWFTDESLRNIVRAKALKNLGQKFTCSCFLDGFSSNIGGMLGQYQERNAWQFQLAKRWHARYEWWRQRLFSASLPTARGGGLGYHAFVAPFFSGVWGRTPIGNIQLEQVCTAIFASAKRFAHPPTMEGCLLPSAINQLWGFSPRSQAASMNRWIDFFSWILSASFRPHSQKVTHPESSREWMEPPPIGCFIFSARKMKWPSASRRNCWILLGRNWWRPGFSCKFSRCTDYWEEAPRVQ